jgi:dienelactone hydrolase
MKYNFAAMLYRAALPALLLLWIATAPAVAQEGALSFSDAEVGALGSGKAGELILPQGAGPFPAVVVLHGCDGVSPHYRIWTRWLASWGYAALLIDSFRPRGIAILCGRGTELLPGIRARDAFAAAAYLRKRADIDGSRIGAIGFSHGGWSVLFAAMQDLVSRTGTVPFKAIVAFYPWCPAVSPPLATDVQILIGDADDWTPVQRCIDFAAKYAERAAHRPALKIYPGATHAFDSRRPDRVYLGHRMRHDPKAAADAVVLTRQFFDRYLR